VIIATENGEHFEWRPIGVIVSILLAKLVISETIWNGAVLS